MQTFGDDRNGDSLNGRWLDVIGALDIFQNLLFQIRLVERAATQTDDYLSYDN